MDNSFLVRLQHFAQVVDLVDETFGGDLSGHNPKLVGLDSSDFLNIINRSKAVIDVIKSNLDFQKAPQSSESIVSQLLILRSRIEKIEFLLKISKENSIQILPYVMQLKESVDYAQHQLTQGEINGVILRLISLNMLCAIFAYLEQYDAELVKELKVIVTQVRELILTEVIACLLKNYQPIPWSMIKNVLEAQVSSLKCLLETIAGLKIASKKLSYHSTITGFAYPQAMINCPKCSLEISVEMSADEMNCPQCGCYINVKARLGEFLDKPH